MTTVKLSDAVVSVTAFLLLAGLIVLGLWGCPRYRVYSQQKDGEAQLAHAKYSREVAVAEAKAKFEAASLLAAADTLRAHGIARSNQIINSSLTELYVRWLFVEQLKETQNQVIYIPTEAGIPIMEANRFVKPPVNPDK